jgi:hypothetical protein
MNSDPKADPVRGKTVRWSFDDGPMAGRTYEHAFGSDGTVTWTEAGQGGAKNASGSTGEDSTAKYEVERMNDDVYVVSYLGKSGYTLTTVVDERAGTIVSFASNEKALVKQHGKVKSAQAG